MDIRIFDNVLPEPEVFRAAVLRTSFQDLNFEGGTTFRGISTDPLMCSHLRAWISNRFPLLQSTTSFFRKSPWRQAEPNMVHTDDLMGEWTGILYLNPLPAPGDGTLFVKHLPSGQIRSGWKEQREADWKDPGKWRVWMHARAAFNRLVMFPADYFHSRAIEENYGTGDDARLIQVVFGKGSLPHD